MAFWFKSCPKCGGDLMLVQEVDGNEIECMQCGRQLPREEQAMLRRYGTLDADKLEQVGRNAERVA